MKLTAFGLLFLISACSGRHLDKPSDLTVNIPLSTVVIDTELELDVFDSNPPVVATKRPIVEKTPEVFLMNCGLYIPEVPDLISMSLPEIEAEYSGLIVTSGYKKWIPIEGESKPVLVFQFSE